MRRGFLAALGIGTVLALANCAPPAMGTPLPERVSRSIATDIDQIQADAARGDARAQYRLGLAYFHGVAVRRDYDKALGQFRKSAARGYPKAEGMLGYYYFNGVGVDGDPTAAIGWYRKAASAGDPLAQVNLDSIYRRGEVVPVDLPEAAKWYRMAAEQDAAEAEFWLSWMASSGKGVPADPAAAATWLEKAANHGHDQAMYFYGLTFYGTATHPPDHIEVLKWVTLAEARLPEDCPVHQYAVDRIQDLRAHMNPDELKEVEARVAAFRPTPEAWDLADK